jgi:hypothetical protein
MSLEASCVWPVTRDIVLAIDTHLGPPVDSYINGAQTWFTDEPELGGITLEWRLHPVAGFEPVAGVAADDRWDFVVTAAADRDVDLDALPIGEATRALSSLWDGLECFVAYGEECEPAPLAQAVTERLGITPAASGLVDHDAIADQWERTHGALSVTDMLLAQLGSLDN